MDFKTRCDLDIRLNTRLIVRTKVGEKSINFVTDKGLQWLHTIHEINWFVSWYALDGVE